ncbi:hypothetical protein EV292_102462 [Sphingomonas sp. BK235]|nr:hypothetical protein EV292_102462 [Sphingomonas sp. BK235]
MRPHNNKGKGPEDLRYKEQMLSHMHSFEDNWDDIAGALTPDNLPIARPIIATLSQFIDFRDYVGLKFGIMNIDLVKTPEWEYVLDLGSE